LESKALDDKNASSARKVGKTKTEEEAKKLTAFRKKAKVGSRVRVFTGNFQAKGLVTEVKKDLVKVQFTEQVIQFQWTSIKPIEQWVQRSNLLPSEGGASLY
jgi:sRNA-binding protein